MHRFLTNILTLLLAMHLIACDAGRVGVNVGNDKKGESTPNANASAWSLVETEEANKICRKDFPTFHSTVSKPELPRICDCITKATSKVAVFEDYRANPVPFWQALHLNGQLTPCTGSDIKTSAPENAPKWVKASPIEEKSGIVSQPILLRDRSGREIAVWLQDVPDKGHSIKVRRMQANGWATISSIANVPSGNSPFAAQVKKNNGLAIVWAEGTSVYAGELPDGGSAVTALKLNDEPTVAVQAVNLAIDQEDQVHVVWQEATPNPTIDYPYRLIYRRYDTTKWSDPYELISGDIKKPSLTTKGKEVLFVWQHSEAGIAGIMAKHFSNNTWSTFNMIDNANVNKWKSSEPFIAASRDYAHVVFLSQESSTLKLNVRSFNWAVKGWLDLNTIYSGPIALSPSITTHGDSGTYVTWMTRGDSGVTVMNASWHLAGETWLTSPVAVMPDADSLVRPRLSINNNGDKLLTYGVRKGSKSIAYAQLEKDGTWGNFELMVEADKKIYDIFANLHDDGTAIGLWHEDANLNYNKRE